MKSFRIIQLADLHLSPHHNEEDERTYDLIRHMVNYYEPDLLLLSGDQIWSEGIIDSDKTFERLIDYLNQFKVQIAITYGNHDTEGNHARSHLRQLESKLLHSAVKHHCHVVDDKEAYVVEIRQKDKLTHLLYMIDGGDYDKLNISHYDYIHPEHVSWIRKIRKHYEAKGFNGTNNILCTHIPLPEYKLVDKAIGKKGINNEGICSPDFNSGMFTQLLLNKDVSFVTCGHDHDNDFQFNLHGINLCFGRISGFHCYGDLTRGGRLFDLTPEGEILTKVIEYDKRFN